MSFNFNNIPFNSDGARIEQADAYILNLLRESSEDDDDLDFEVARNIFRKAENSLAAQDYHDAKRLFQEELVIADNLNVKRRDAFELKRMKMHYADCCCYFINDFSNAEHVYQQMMKKQFVTR